MKRQTILVLCPSPKEPVRPNEGKSAEDRGLVGWFAVLGVVGVAIFLYAAHESRAELEAAYPGTYRTVDGLRLRSRDSGPRHALAVILLHGFGASLDTWEPWAQALSARFRVIRLDLPGLGLTVPIPLSIIAGPRDADPGRPDPLSSSKGQVGVLDPVVGVTADLAHVSITDVCHDRSIGVQPIGGDRLG